MTKSVMTVERTGDVLVLERPPERPKTLWQVNLRLCFSTELNGVCVFLFQQCVCARGFRHNVPFGATFKIWL